VISTVKNIRSIDENVKTMGKIASNLRILKR
jgi:hypothetical protein